jgi:hypothetical protein
MTAKKQSELKGRDFLQESFCKEQRVLETKLSLASWSVTHAGKAGEVTENHFLEQMRSYLPHRYKADSAIIIDSEGRTSDQIDIVIYDNQYTPILLDQAAHKYVPAEAVYAVIEVKPEINTTYLKYAGDKAASVRRLTRTTVPIVQAGMDKPTPAKAPFRILSGLVAARASWGDGLGAAFQKQHARLKDAHAIDCLLALGSGSYDVFDGKPQRCAGGNALIFFLFRLLKQLQTLGTVPAIDWNAYANQLRKN